MYLISYTFLKDENQLDKLPEQLMEASMEALNEAADFMVMMAQCNVLVDTGTLQRSIRKESYPNIVKVKAGGYQFINPKTNKPCNYARYVEANYPFMRPAYETIKSFLADKIAQKILTRVQE